MAAAECAKKNRPYCCFVVEVRSVRSIDDAAILRRARGLCEADRLAWDYSAFVASRGRGSLKGVIDEEARRDYLTRARAQLLRESSTSAA